MRDTLLQTVHERESKIRDEVCGSPYASPTSHIHAASLCRWAEEMRNRPGHPSACTIVSLVAIFILMFAWVHRVGAEPVYVYSVKLGPFPVARATLEMEQGIRLDSRPVDRIVVTAKTRRFPFMFRADNRYESYIDPSAGHSLRFTSVIHQSNLSRTLTAEYDQDQHLARFSDGSSAPILEHACDFFAALFYLSRQDADPAHEFAVNLDVEGIPWTARIEILGREAIGSPWGKMHATETRIRFHTDHPDAGRSRKTDILTNRLVRSGTDLRIWFSEEEGRWPLKLTYDGSPFNIVAELKGIEQTPDDDNP